MTKLTESATYSPTIFRLETTTPVAGGAVVLDGNDDPVQGHANAQAQLLANRTKYLKTIIDALGTASTANLTTSPVDTAAGRVLKVGDFGLGTDTQITATGDLNGIRYGGIFSPIGQLNQPSSEIVLWSGGRTGGARAAQFAVSLDGVSYARGYNAGRPPGTEWSPWATGWSSLTANVITVDTGSFGYGTGSGGTVTQATSKATAVTLNKPSGTVTMHNESLAAGASVQFQLINSKVSTLDTVIMAMRGGGSLTDYSLRAYIGTAGSIYFVLKNESAAPLAQAYQFNFTIIKGASA